MITKATELLINGIDKLKLVFPAVEVINVKGNHDETSMFGIMQTLSAYYRCSPTVDINTNSRFRQYYRFGHNLIGMSHNEKIQDIAKIMAAERREDWGDTSKHYFFLGHLHHRREIGDDHGVDIYGLPSVTGLSAWASGEGYCGTNKVSQSFVFDYNKGLVEILNTII